MRILETLEVNAKAGGVSLGNHLDKLLAFWEKKHDYNTSLDWEVRLIEKIIHNSKLSCEDIKTDL